MSQHWGGQYSGWSDGAQQPWQQQQQQQQQQPWDQQNSNISQLQNLSINPLEEQPRKNSNQNLQQIQQIQQQAQSPELEQNNAQSGNSWDPSQPWKGEWEYNQESNKWFRKVWDPVTQQTDFEEWNEEIHGQQQQQSSASSTTVSSSEWTGQATFSVNLHVCESQEQFWTTQMGLDNTSTVAQLKEMGCQWANLTDPSQYEMRPMNSDTALDMNVTVLSLKMEDLRLCNIINFPSRMRALSVPTGARVSALKITLLENSVSQGASFTIKYDPNSLIKEMKEKCCEKRGIDANLFQAIHPASTQVIPDSQNVAELGIPEIILRKVPPPTKLSRRESVRIHWQSPNGQVVIKTFPNSLSAYQAKMKFIEEENLDPNVPSWLCIKEIGFVLSEDNTLLRLLPLVQTSLFNGINPVFELVFEEPFQYEGFNDVAFTNFLKKEAGMYELIGQSYSVLLSQCKEEVNEARSKFAHVLVNYAEHLKSLNSTDDENYAYKEYFKEEMNFVYMENEPPLTDPMQVLKVTITFPGQFSKTVETRGDYPVRNFIEECFQRWYNINPQQACNFKPDDFVLKVVGLSEYIIPFNENIEQMILGQFDYVRMRGRKGETLQLGMVPRVALHKLTEAQEGESDTFRENVINRTLGRSVWREAQDESAIVYMTEVQRFFRVKVLSAANLRLPELSSKKDNRTIFVCAGIYFGGELLANFVNTVAVSPKYFLSGSIPPEWSEWLTFNIPTNTIPKESRICFTLYCSSEIAEGTIPTKITEKETPLGWCAVHLLNYRLQLVTGEFKFKLWDGEANPIGQSIENTLTSNPVLIHVEFESNTKICEFPPPEIFDNIQSTSLSPSYDKINPSHLEKFKQIMSYDSLLHLTAEEGNLLWKYRDLICETKPKGLAKLLRSVCWSNPDMVREAHRLVKKMELMHPNYALELLDAKFADEEVRAYAVKCLEKMTDAEVFEYLLQLVQALKYESHHDSPLARFVLLRALKNKNKIGNAFYWLMRSEMHVVTISERYGVLLEAYLRGCGSYQQEIFKQHTLLRSLEAVALQIKETPKENRLAVLKTGLAAIKFPENVQLPIDPRFVVKGLVLEKCKYMDSKKLPLWLVFQNIEDNAPPIYIIFKVGDDLRQDILTLQMIRIMDRIWKQQGMDLRMEPYRVVATGDQIGMVEVVLNSDTTGNIYKDAGGTFGVMKDDTITLWLKSNNKTPREWELAQHAFTLSCAGYCVATYVLGIGDRHSDNVMVKRTGQLFHIDFGHFLGNFKSKLGVKRERAPFKFTSQFYHVMGGKGPKFAEFEEICGKAYNLLRQPQTSYLFITLFSLMLSTGIPELQHEDDIAYLRNAFAFEMDNLAASDHFKKLILEALSATSQTINDLFHAMAH